MRKSFENALRGYNALAKGEQAKDKGAEEASVSDVAQLENDFEKRLEEVTSSFGRKIKDKEKVYELQKEKLAVIGDLKEKLACIDNPDCVMEHELGARPARFDAEQNRFFYKSEKGEEAPATPGEVMTDMTWGVRYDLDPATTPRKWLKEYFLRSAKQRLMELLDQQLVYGEKGNMDLGINVGSRSLQELGNLSVARGFIAEQMVINLLDKCNLDGEAPFEVFLSDVYQDNNQKVDFFLKTKRQKGYDLEPKTFGIQFTLKQGDSKKRQELEAAKKSLARRGVDNTVYVVVRLKHVITLFDEWRKSGSPAGGPDKMLSVPEAKMIFDRTLAGVMLVPERDALWQKMEPYFINKTVPEGSKFDQLLLKEERRDQAKSLGLYHALKRAEDEKE